MKCTGSFSGYACDDPNCPVHRPQKIEGGDPKPFKATYREKKVRAAQGKNLGQHLVEIEMASQEEDDDE